MPHFSANFWLLNAAVLVCAALQAPKEPPRGPFGYTMLSTVSGKPVPIESFGSAEDCGTCHQRQFEEFAGSFHSVAHADPLYRAFAEMALKEAGPEIYAWCSGCHSPAGVAAGLIPGKTDAELPAAAKSGVTCDVCHQISRLSGPSGPWSTPGNASVVLEPSPVKRGPLDDIQSNPSHTAVQGAYFASSELCASCHTVIVPVNGLHVERTFAEWKSSIYAEKGVQCQDCHMRLIADAIQVAETLNPKTHLGRASLMSAKDRPIREHFFVGANSNIERLTGDAPRVDPDTERLTEDAPRAEMARERLRSAARLSITTRAPQAGGAPLAFEVVVQNIGAGHALPTSLTELRQMWLAVRVVSADGRIVHESGALDEHGELSKGTVRFGSDLGDAQGKLTYKPWEAKSILWERVILPKAKDIEHVEVDVPAGTVGPLRIEARLFYRSASPRVLREVMGDKAFDPEIVEMASSSAEIAWR